MNGSSNSWANSGGFSRPNSASPNIFRHERPVTRHADLLCAVSIETGSTDAFRLQDHIDERSRHELDPVFDMRGPE